MEFWARLRLAFQFIVLRVLGLITPDMLVAGNSLVNLTAASGQTVTAETTKAIATAYRAGNIVSDDVAKMPLQVFRRRPGSRDIERVEPSALARDIAYRVEIEPNRWMTPFVFKKAVMLWLQYWGNAYLWRPAGQTEIFILPANVTQPVFDEAGELWYETTFATGKQSYIPAVEILHLMINSQDGITGRSVISYARDTLGRQQAAHETQDKIYSQGLTGAAAIWVNGDLNGEARERVREAYTSSVSGSSKAGQVAIFDSKIAKLETIPIKATDAQFLESIQATDADIANFFGVPLYKLNMGKQSYESNAQQDLDYLKTTLDPYLVQWEQGAALAWLPLSERTTTYFRFNRDVVLRTDAKTRAEYLEKKILSGQMTPNEARQVEDLPPFPGGDAHYLPANMAVIAPDGALIGGAPAISIASATSSATPVAVTAGVPGSNGRGEHA